MQVTEKMEQAGAKAFLSMDAKQKAAFLQQAAAVELKEGAQGAKALNPTNRSAARIAPSLTVLGINNSSAAMISAAITNVVTGHCQRS